MQTFLPYPDLQQSLKVLDYKRLGKQRVEASQLLSAILNRPTKKNQLYKGWVRHPICQMWSNNVNALKLYHNLAIEEWVSRRYKNNMPFESIEGEIILPIWLGNKDFHASHRANLLRKNYEFYSKYEWLENHNMPYLWYDMIKENWYSVKTKYN